jgi:hypothetical protein
MKLYWNEFCVLKGGFYWYVQIVIFTHDKIGIKLLFAEEQVIIAHTEDSLQKSAHELNRLIIEYDIPISVRKTKSMAFEGRDPVRTKIIMDNKITEQVKLFKCLGQIISYERELDIDKLNSYLKITGILNV